MPSLGCNVIDIESRQRDPGTVVGRRSPTFGRASPAFASAAASLASATLMRPISASPNTRPKPVGSRSVSAGSTTATAMKAASSRAHSESHESKRTDGR